MEPQSIFQDKLRTIMVDNLSSIDAFIQAGSLSSAAALFSDSLRLLNIFLCWGLLPRSDISYYCCEMKDLCNSIQICLDGLMDGDFT